MVSLTRKIAEETAFNTLSNISTAVFSLLTFIIIVRILGTFEYGLIVLTLSAINIAAVFLDYGLKGVIISDTSRERGKNRYDRVKSILWRFYQIEIIMAVLLFVVVYSSNTYFEQTYSSLVGELVRISSFLILAKAGKIIFLTTFKSHIDFKSVFYFTTGENVSKFVYVLLFGYFLKFGVYGVILAYPLSLFSAILISSFRFFRIYKIYRPVTRSKDAYFFNIMKSHGKWAVFTRPVKKIGDEIVPWIIQFFLSVDAVAIFNVAKRAINYLGSLTLSIGDVMMPIISQEIHNIKKLNRIVNKTVKFSVWFTVPIIIISIVFSPFLFVSLFGVAYAESVGIFQVLTIALFFIALELTMRPLLFGFRKQKRVLFLYLVTLSVFAFFAIILTSLIGLYGMVVAFIIKGFLTFMLRYREIKKEGIKIGFMEIVRMDNYDRKVISKIRGRIKSALRL